MTETLELATTSPSDEPCVQVTQEKDYMSMSRIEARAFINQLERMSEAGTFGERGNAGFRIITCHHDFGSYLDVEVRYSDRDEAGESFAFEVEGNLPEEWDDEARAELGLEYFEYLDDYYGFDKSK